MEEKTLSAGEALHKTFTALSGALIPYARDEAEFILMHVLKCRRHELFINAKRPLTPEEAACLEEATARRLLREPAQYIFGEAEFMGRAFKVSRGVLIPRPETELLVEEAIKEAPSFGPGDLTIIDLCTGSGCIAVSTALEIKNSHVYATDISDKALIIAKENAGRLSAAGKITFLPGDLFGPVPAELKAKTHMVLTNPPYITEKDMAALAPEVADFEPKEALYGGVDGLDIIRRILDSAHEYLAAGGLLLMEIGYDQSKAVLELAESSGEYEKIEILKDYGGIGRILKARSKQRPHP
ncbi:MAG: peptide chain release factor N(5)-glutamine methyltransferase [Deltaproteobacteria bacterium]|nr:peptide chain release factor N(5)-glutamine methyltransferase [Deltaproteobacteria bacterium]